MNEFYLGFKIDDKAIQLSRKVSEVETDNFVRLADVAELDKRRDFRFSNLENVNFSNCDLAGFDFTGANLKGAFGRNVNWDNSTILKDARLENSMFSLDFRLKQEVYSNNESMKLFKKVNSSYWPDKLIWIYSSRKNLSGRRSLLEALFQHSDDNYEKGEILEHISQSYVRDSKKLEFLVSSFANCRANSHITKKIISILAREFFDEENVRLMLLNDFDLLESGSQAYVIDKILSSKPSSPEVFLISNQVRISDSKVVRITFVNSLAHILGDGFLDFVRDPATGDVFDTHEKISSQKSLRMAIKIKEKLNNSKVKYDSSSFLFKNLYLDANTKVVRIIEILLEVWRRLNAYGFSISWAPELLEEVHAEIEERVNVGRLRSKEERTEALF